VTLDRARERAARGWAYAPIMRTLYMATGGTSDPTRASIPLHLAVNGSLELDHSVGIVLAGDAAELVKADVRERLEGVGLPPIRDLFAKARQHEVPVYV
jgi:predicted peroxiredoxin